MILLLHNVMFNWRLCKEPMQSRQSDKEYGTSKAEIQPVERREVLHVHLSRKLVTATSNADANRASILDDTLYGYFTSLSVKLRY